MSLGTIVALIEKYGPISVLAGYLVVLTSYLLWRQGKADEHRQATADRLISVLEAQGAELQQLREKKTRKRPGRRERK